MKLWITRGKSGAIELFQEKPTLISNSFFSRSDGFGTELQKLYDWCVENGFIL